MTTMEQQQQETDQRAACVALIACLLAAQPRSTKPGATTTRAQRRRNPERGLYRRPRSPFWWMRWTDARGRQQRESTRTADRDEARRQLRDKLGVLARGEPVAVNASRITVNALLDDLENDYRAQGQVLEAMAPNVARLRAALGRYRAVELTTTDLR